MKHASDLGTMLILHDHRATTPSRVLTQGFCDVGRVGHGLCDTYEELAQVVLEGLTIGDVEKVPWHPRVAPCDLVVQWRILRELSFSLQVCNHRKGC